MTDPRTYVRLSDGLPDNPKIAMAGGDAAWLYVCGLCYCARQFTDGHLPAAVVPRLSDRAEPLALARRLVELGLWHASGHDCSRCPEVGPDGYVVHDYLDHQRSAEDIAALRRKRKAAGQRGGQAKAARAKSPSKPLASAIASAVANAKQTASKPLADTETDTDRTHPPSGGVQAHAPARTRDTTPDRDLGVDVGGNFTEAQDAQVLPMLVATAPPPPAKSTRRKRAAGAGERIPDDWTVSPALVAWTRKAGVPDSIARREAAKFKDYWLQSADPKAWKLDWNAAYRTWLSRWLEDQSGLRAVPAIAAQKRNPVA